MKLSHLPLRATIGAFVLHSGLAKRDLEGQAAESMQVMAAGAMPRFRQMPPERFGKFLSNAEVALGVALLLPAVPSALAGTGLASFGAGLLRMYWKTPGMHEPGDPRPTRQGLGLAKDVWLLGAGLTLLLDDLLLRRRGRRGGMPRMTHDGMRSMRGGQVRNGMRSMRGGQARNGMWGMRSGLSRQMYRVGLGRGKTGFRSYLPFAA